MNKTCLNNFWCGLILFLVAASPMSVTAQSRDPIADLAEARRIFIPFEDLDVVMERDKQGVLLTKAKFDVLMTQASANAEKNAIPAGVPVVVTGADYAARIVGDQLLISVTVDVTRFDDDWRESRFSLQRLAVEQALFDDVPALTSRHPDGTVSLFTESRGKHTLKLQLSTELNALGSDQVAAFAMLGAPSGTLTLSLPAGKRLLIGNLQLERPAPLDQVADYKIAVGGLGGLQLRVTDRAAENSSDALTFASTGYGLHVAPGEVTWHALTTLQIFGKPVDRLTFSIPRTLEIADIAATGLESWDLTDDGNDPLRTNISLTFGQAFDGTRKISFKGVMAVETGKTWAVPPLRITNATSHIGQVMIQYPAGVRLRVEETAGVRRATHEQKPAADMPDDLSQFNATEFLRFDVWQPDFTLRLTTQPKQREVQSAVAVVLDVNATGLELQAALSVETRFAPLFELDIRLPAEWQVLSALRDDKALKWQMVGLDEAGVNQVRILLDPPIAAEASGQIRLSLRRDVEGWPVESDPVTVNLPELFLPQSSLSEGAFVIRGDDDLDLVAYDTAGLDPQPLKAAFERLRFQSQDTRYAGKLRVTRKPSRVAAQTITFGRIDPQTYHAFIQSVVEVQGGGVRTIAVALPESAGTSIRFECPGPRIVEQKPAAPRNGERVWTLQFDQRLRGQALIVCDLELPRGDTKEFVVPQCRFVDAERQNGFMAVEAGGEQRLTISANDASGIALPEVDPLELPNVFYMPKERIVSVLRAAAPGAILTLSEQKFEKLPVTTAICPLLQISSILGRTGELQHRATFALNAVGVQGLHVTLPKGSTLWATLVDGRPVEVRRNDNVYLVPVTSAVNDISMQNQNDSPVPDGLRMLQLFYRSEVAAVSQFGTLAQDPPLLTVESGQRTALPVEVLEQKWDLYYPDETRLVESRSPLEPRQPLDRTSMLGNWNSNLRIPTLVDLGRQLLVVIVAIGLVALLIYGFRKKGKLVSIVVASCLVMAVLVALALPSVQQARYSSEKSASSGHTRAGTDKLYETSNDAPMAPPSAAPSTEQWQRAGLKSESPPPPGFSMPQQPRPAEELSKHIVRNRTRISGEGVDPFAKEDHPEKNDAKESTRLGVEVAQDEVPHNERVMVKGKIDHDFDDAESEAMIDQVRGLGLLSLAIDFVPPAGSREKTFHYVGSDSSVTGIPLEVDYVDRHSGAALRVFVMALVAMIGWFLRRASLPVRIGLATIGFAVPLAMFPLVPIGWQVALDGVVCGTLVAVVMWLMCALIHGCRCCRPGLVQLAGKPAAIALLLAMALIESPAAAEDQQAATAQPASGIKPPMTLVIPFDAGTEPLASERVFLSHEQFLQLYRLANPDKVTKQTAPNAGGICEAIYAAKLVRNEQRPDESVVEVIARYAVTSYTDGQLIVELPVGPVAAREAKLDGQSAALISSPGCFKVAVSKPGLHVIDFAFDVPAKLSGTTGSFSLPLLPVPAGKLVLELPGKDLSIRVNGSSTIFRRVTQETAQSLEFPIDKGGEIAIAWQPQQAQGAATAVVHVDSVEAITLTDAGAAVSHGFAWRVRQGGIADVSLTLPDSLRLQAVNGPDVGGWELQGDGAARKLRIIFRRNVTDQTRLTIETFLDVKIATAATTIAVPQIAPLEVTNEIGQVAVFAGNQFSVRTEQVESLSQIDSDKFTTQIPVSRPNVAPQLAYRFSKRPFILNLRASRQESQAHVTSQQAAFVTLRKQQLTTRLRYHLTGAPRSSLSVALPANFVLLDVQATGLRDYYVAKETVGSTLTIELKSPRLGLTEVIIGGFVARDNATASIVFPQPLDATRLESAAAVWLDEGFAGTLESFDSWRSVDAAQVSAELRAVRPDQLAQFAFASTNTSPAFISLNLKQSTPKLSANGLSMVTVTDVAVIYTLALQWQIDAARTDTLTLTTPDWLAGKLDFQGDGMREATHADAGNNRTRWTISLRSPVSGKYFATATATLPPAATEVLAPPLVFEHEQKPLDPQRQYVLLINSSLGQLSSVEPTLVESVQREDLPVVVDQKIVDQATELVRVKSLLTAPRWSLHKFAQQQGAPASVNIADLTTVLSRDGTYRAQALYTIKNRTRQFLALQMPEGTELLSVFTGGRPSRAVTAKLASLNGASAQLIALPKSSAASLSFTVKIVWRGRLGSALPKSATLVREEFPIPAPQILSQQEDADFGIPVARTRWTVYLPDDLDGQASRLTAKHNLSLSGETDSLYGNAALQETSELLGYLEQTIENSRRNKSQNNMKQLGLATSNLKQLEQTLQGYRSGLDAEFSKNRADVLKRLSDVEKLAKDESQKTFDYFRNSNQQQLAQGKNSIQLDDLSDGESIANEQRRFLNLSNSGDGISIEHKSGDVTTNFNFDLNIKDSEDLAESAKAGGKPMSKALKNPANFENRSQLRSTNDANLDVLNKTVTDNNTIRIIGNGIQIQGEQGSQGGHLRLPVYTNGGAIANGDNDISGFNVNGLPQEDFSGINPGMSGRGNQFFKGLQGPYSGQANPMLSGENVISFNGSQSYGPGGGGGGGMGGGQQGGRRARSVRGAEGISAAQRKSNLNSQSQPQGMTINGPIAGSATPDMRLPESKPENGRMSGTTNWPDSYMVGQTGRAAITDADQLVALQQNGGQVAGLGGGQSRAVWRQAGGLSLDINLPASGHKLVFTKAGGDPKLALAIRPQASIRWGISLVWSAVWVLIGITVLVTLRSASGLNRLIHQLPMALAIFGVIGFCVLPSPLNAASFALFLVSTVITAWKRFSPAIAG